MDLASLFAVTGEPGTLAVLGLVLWRVKALEGAVASLVTRLHRTEAEVHRLQERVANG